MNNIASLPDTIEERRFEFKSDKSYKFWAIQLRRDSLVIRYGRIGSKGQSREYGFPSTDAAKKEYLKRIREKTSAGYEEHRAQPRRQISTQQMWEVLETHEPFLRQILEDPDDVTGYLIYSDWLIEQNDPRGQFTQLQIQLEQSSTPIYRRPQLEKQANQLRLQHVREWIGALAPWLMLKQGPLELAEFEFARGQLSEVSVFRFSLDFGQALKDSPCCRLLRRLGIENTGVLTKPMEVGGKKYQPNRDYGLETLIGADFSNLREFGVGVTDFQAWESNLDTFAAGHVIDLVATMPRLETLCVDVPINWNRLFSMPMQNLKWLRCAVGSEDIPTLIGSGIMRQLDWLMITRVLNDQDITALCGDDGFRSMIGFGLRYGQLSDAAKDRLLQTGVEIEARY